MNNQNKRIIPNHLSVARLLDQEIVDILGSNSTFIFEEFIKAISGFDAETIIKYLDTRVSRILEDEKNKDYLCGRLHSLISEVTEKSKIPSQSILVKALFAGVNCDLLEPNGQGWKKGKVKFLLEFIPEEDTLSIIEENLASVENSSLDEIRQLASNLPIEQN